MFRQIKLLSLLFVCLPLTSCLSWQAMVRQSAERDLHADGIGHYNKHIGSYGKWNKVNGKEKIDFYMSYLCFSYYEMRKFDKALSCIKFYEKFHLPEYVKQKKLGGLDTEALVHSPEARFYEVISSLYFDFGDYQKAYDYASQGYESLKVNGGDTYQVSSFPAVVAKIFAIKAMAALQLNKKDEAVELVNAIPKIHIDRGLFGKAVPSEQLKIINAAQARVYMALGSYDKASKAINKSDVSGVDVFVRLGMAVATAGLSEFTWSGDITNPYIMDNVYMQSKICFKTGKLGCAKKGYDSLIAGGRSWFEALNGYAIESRAGLFVLVQHERGLIALNEGDHEQALTHFKKSIELIESQRATLNTEASKIGFVGDKFAVYRDAVDLLVGMKRYDEAFAFVERGKARALVDMLSNKQQFDNKSKQKSNIALLKNLTIAENISYKKVDKNNNQNLDKQRAVHRALLRKRQKEIIQNQPELASLVTVSAPSISDLQSKLPANETLVEYYGDDKQLYAFVMSKSGVGAIKLNAQNIKQDIRDFRSNLMQPKTNKYKSIGLKLYTQLVSPVVKHIKTKNVTFVPHGALHYLPFSALPTKKAHLLDYYNIRILPSASVMTFLNKKSKANGSLLTLGNPDLNDPHLDLPGAQKEAIAITSKLKGAKLLLRKKATETAVKQYGGNFKYLHFASHGVFDPDKPLQSGLLLSKDAINDGNLTVGELYDLTLNADLVTLSACETALGKVANGDDVVGFTRGFLYAGAKSIVSSLWKVDDRATNKLMQSFYANLRQKDKRSALRAAQLTTKKQYNHPYYWAAFQLTGAIN